MQKIKIKKKELKVGNGIEEKDFSLRLCGNCAHYVWSSDGDRHKGDCLKAKEEECIEFVLMVKVPNGLHALTGAMGCKLFELDKNDEVEMEIFVDRII